MILSFEPPRKEFFKRYNPEHPHVLPGRYVRYLTDVRWSVTESLIRSLEGRRLSLHRKLPKTESLRDCMDRTVPYFRDRIVPGSLNQGKRVLVASSENAIRGLLMHLCDIPTERISEVRAWVCLSVPGCHTRGARAQAHTCKVNV